MMDFNSRRSPVLGTRGMVATSQPLAVAAGLEVLAAGGNAADAAVATAAALNVTEPTSTGIGGDAFALYYDAETGSVSSLNGSGRAPAALTLARLQADTRGKLKATHPHTVTVPGACSAWCQLVERHGRLEMAAVLAPAIRLAEEGFPVAPVTAYFWERSAERLLVQAPNGGEMLIDGRAPFAGEIFRNPGLARTFRRVAEGGTPAFYEGEIADAIVAVLDPLGGAMTVDDLAAHRATWDEPISTTYRGHRVWECPPNGQGLAALIALNVLEGFDVAGSGPLSAERLHWMIEAMRLGFADGNWYIADPETDPAPLGALLSKDYAAERRGLIDLDQASVDPVRGAPAAGSDTVYLSVVDGDGNACSFINSNYMGFGTGIVPQGWGFTLQNRGYGFSLEKGHPNVLAPGKRPYHTIIPGLITRPSEGREELFACYGVMGGYMQPQGHLQMAVALLDDGLDPQTALDRPRFCIENGEAGGVVSLEEGLQVEVIRALSGMGHEINLRDGWARSIFGRGQIIVREETGVLWGGSDPRADGVAMSL